MVTSPSKTFMLSITIFVHSLFDPEVMLPYPPVTPSTLIDFSCSISVLPMTWPSQNNHFIRLSNDRQCDAFPMQQNVKKYITLSRDPKNGAFHPRGHLLYIPCPVHSLEIDNKSKSKGQKTEAQHAGLCRHVHMSTLTNVKCPTSQRPYLMMLPRILLESWSELYRITHHLYPPGSQREDATMRKQG